MKALIGIIVSSLIILAGAAAAWADCRRLSFDQSNQNRAGAASHAHSHHSDADHEHSDDAVVHCPTLDPFVAVAKASPSEERRVERLQAALVNGSSSLIMQHDLRFSRGPPGSVQLRTLPTYLLLSALLI
jgi:ABC-type nickel/cobalt efflux system permease component RcnA